MRRGGVVALGSLSPRERDCLRLLESGLENRQVASNLGISVSTLHKHLFSARRKLGVRRTTQAVLLYAQTNTAPLQQERPTDGAHGETPALHDFAIALEQCHTFDEAWNALRDHADRLGVSTMACGVVAEPPGMLTNGARAIKRLWPDYITEMYYAMGGERADPTIPYVVTHTNSAVMDTERILRTLGSDAPKPVLAFGEVLLDANFRFQLHQPFRDSVTGAPLMTMFRIDSHAINDFRRNGRRMREAFRLMSAAFWDCVQSRGLLSSVPNLSSRQVEALRLAARGFSLAETAEHMGVSVRLAEKTLAAARKRLGARTTAAALYRAMVYRALD
jgi:DNA-binding CsgD family transcriptional regulator